jgi:hypothetical protein
VPCLVSARWKAFDIYSNISGVCGEFITLKTNTGRNFGPSWFVSRSASPEFRIY